MKKLIRLLIAAAATVAILAAALVVLLLNPPGAETGRTVLADHAATDIVSVEITNEAGTFQVHAQTFAECPQIVDIHLVSDILHGNMSRDNRVILLRILGPHGQHFQ